MGKNNNDNPKPNKKAKVNPDLEGFDISFDTFGEIQSSLSIDKLNEFLNKNVKDKKLNDPPSSKKNGQK